MQPDVHERLCTYHALLLKWQKAINLVSRNTVEDAWARHFEDSLQLLPLLPQVPGRLVDLGSGGGFPGLVLAIARPDVEVHLIESDQRKCSFLSTVSRETGCGASVHNGRIEDVLPGIEGPVDVVTARALAELPALCALSWPVFERNPGATAIFMKGRKAGAEVEAAAEKWNFVADDASSKTDPEAAILILREIRPR